MNKPLKIASKVLLALAVVMLGVSILLPPILQTDEEVAFSAMFILNTTIVVFATVGSMLIYANNDTAKKVGHGLTVGAFVVLLFNALTSLIDTKEATSTTPESKSISIAAVFMLVAAVLLAAYYVLQFVQLLINKGASENGSPSDDLRIVRVKEWKQLLDEGIITQEEFEEKRVQILGLKPKQDK